MLRTSSIKFLLCRLGTMSPSTAGPLNSNVQVQTNPFLQDGDCQILWASDVPVEPVKTQTLGATSDPCQFCETEAGAGRENSESSRALLMLLIWDLVLKEGGQGLKTVS